MSAAARRMTSLVLFCVLFFVALETAWAKKRPGSSNMLQRREVDTFSFVRLMVMRLIYGFAKILGFDEALGEVMNGAFVPPGAEDDDYGDYF